MRKTITVGAALVIALTAAGHDVEATHSSADVVLEVEPASSKHATSAGQSPDTPFLLDDAHRDVRCDQRHRARFRTLSGPIAARVGGIDQGRGSAGCP